MEVKLFKVSKFIIPEWGKTKTEFIKYFLAKNIDVVEAIVKERYGPLNRYFSYDRCEVKITICEMVVELL
jgi:hypothetical protein